MSILATYREKQELVRKLEEEMRKLEENTLLKQELTFKEEVEELLKKHDRDVYDLIGIFGLTVSEKAGKAAGRGNRRARKLKVYVNPNNQERVETRGGNQKKLKEWKALYGADEVESWLLEERE